MDVQQDCEYDAVEIRSGLDQHSRLHGTYCGSQPPQPVTSDSNAVRVTFTSDNTVQKSGFSAFFFTGDNHVKIQLARFTVLHYYWREQFQTISEDVSVRNVLMHSAHLKGFGVFRVWLMCGLAAFPIWYI